MFFQRQPPCMLSHLSSPSQLCPEGSWGYQGQVARGRKETLRIDMLYRLCTQSQACWDLRSHCQAPPRLPPYTLVLPLPPCFSPVSWHLSGSASAVSQKAPEAHRTPQRMGLRPQSGDFTSPFGPCRTPALGTIGSCWLPPHLNPALSLTLTNCPHSTL